jgi:hypothetical protein
MYITTTTILEKGMLRFQRNAHQASCSQQSNALDPSDDNFEIFFGGSLSSEPRSKTGILLGSRDYLVFKEVVATKCPIDYSVVVAKTHGSSAKLTILASSQQFFGGLALGSMVASTSVMSSFGKFRSK